MRHPAILATILALVAVACGSGTGLSSTAPAAAAGPSSTSGPSVEPSRPAVVSAAPSAGAVDPTPFPATGIVPVVPAGWTTHELHHIGLRVAVPPDWHVVTLDERDDPALQRLDLDTRADLRLAFRAPALSGSIVSSYALFAVAPDKTGFVVLEVRNASQRDDAGAVDVESPAGAAKLDATTPTDVYALVRVQPDWSLAVGVRTSAKAPAPADELAARLIRSIEPIGPPATTVGHIGLDSTTPLPDLPLAGWLPAKVGDRDLNAHPAPGRFLLVQPTVVKMNLLGVGNVFDLCLSMASTVDEIGLGIGAMAPVAGQPNASILVCRADRATNAGWIDAVATLIPRGPVRAAGDRPIWHATASNGQTIGLLAAGRAAVEVIADDPALVNVVLAAIPPDL